MDAEEFPMKLDAYPIKDQLFTAKAGSSSDSA